MALNAGVSTTDITPPVGYLLCGHVRRDQPSEMVHDPLRLKALYLKNGKQRIAILTGDLPFIPDPLMERFRKGIFKRTGLKPGEVMTATSHTHTGPFMCAEDEPGRAPIHIPGYDEILVEKLYSAVLEAKHRAEPVTAHWGVTECEIGAINRRMMTPAGSVHAPNPDGPVDTTLPVLRFDRKDKSPLAVLFCYSCHPTTVGTDIYQVSADFPGAAQRRIEAALPGVTAMFLQGCCGDIRPNVVSGKWFTNGTFIDVERMGRALADGTLKALKQSTPVEGNNLTSRAKRIKLPLMPDAVPKTQADVTAMAKRFGPQLSEFPQFVEAWAKDWRKRIRNGERVPSTTPLDLHVIRIGDVVLCGMAAEVMVEIGMRLRARLGEKTIVVGDMEPNIGYLPTAEATSEGGYEGCFHFLAGWPAPLSPKAQDVAFKAVEKLAR